MRAHAQNLTDKLKVSEFADTTPRSRTTPPPGTVTVAPLNKVQHTDEENPITFALNVTSINNLGVAFGYVTEANWQDSTTATYGSQGAVVGSAETWWDLNGTYTWQKLAVGGEVLVADQIVDMAYMLVGNYTLPLTKESV